MYWEEDTKRSMVQPRPPYYVFVKWVLVRRWSVSAVYMCILYIEISSRGRGGVRFQKIRAGKPT